MKNNGDSYGGAGCSVSLAAIASSVVDIAKLLWMPLIMVLTTHYAYNYTSIATTAVAIKHTLKEAAIIIILIKPYELLSYMA